MTPALENILKLTALLLASAGIFAFAVAWCVDTFFIDDIDSKE